MDVIVERITPIRIMREACEMTFNGKSEMSIQRMAMYEHSPLRTLLYWVKLYDIPLFCSTQLLRHHVGSQAFQLTCRSDRKGGHNHFKERIDAICESIRAGSDKDAIDELVGLKDNADRYTKVNLGLCLNAQALINMAKERLCSDASLETREIFKAIKAGVEKVDPELGPFLVPKCIYRGGICNGVSRCGFNKTDLFKKTLEQYKKLFI